MIIKVLDNRDKMLMNLITQQQSELEAMFNNENFKGKYPCDEYDLPNMSDTDISNISKLLLSKYPNCEFKIINCDNIDIIIYVCN